MHAANFNAISSMPNANVNLNAMITPPVDDLCKRVIAGLNLNQNLFTVEPICETQCIIQFKPKANPRAPAEGPSKGASIHLDSNRQLICFLPPSYSGQESRWYFFETPGEFQNIMVEGRKLLRT